MGKYRVELQKFGIKSIQLTEQEVPANDTIPEDKVGDIMYVILNADSDAEAREKAERLMNNLKSRG